MHIINIFSIELKLCVYHLSITRYTEKYFLPVTCISDIDASLLVKKSFADKEKKKKLKKQRKR